MNAQNFDDKELLQLLQNNDARAIEMIFKKYHSTLCMTAYRFMKSQEASKDVVQEVFMRFWAKRESIQVKTSLKAYLRRSVVNTALNHLQRNRRNPTDDLEKVRHNPSNKHSAQDTLQAQQLEVDIKSAIEQLPRKCRMVFTLSRYEHMSYKEIAETLQISTNTVENHISKAMKILRKELKGYLKK